MAFSLRAILNYGLWFTCSQRIYNNWLFNVQTERTELDIYASIKRKLDQIKALI